MTRQATAQVQQTTTHPLSQGGILQRKCTSCGQHKTGGGTCANCRANGAKTSAPDLPVIQTKLTVGAPNDRYEQEADRVADQIMRMPAPAGQADMGLRSQRPSIQRKCAQCDDEQRLQMKQSLGGTTEVTPAIASRIQSLQSGGQPLPDSARSFFEPRLGQDFSHVRVRTDAQSTQALNAKAYTVGSNIVFGAGQYSPATVAGKRLLAHELVHTVQQKYANGLSDYYVVQRFPGDGMLPPGDCAWAKYLLLRGSVETAKAVVSTLGACAAGDSCLFLATKIAAISAEIAARVALDATCFKGGDTGHRQQVQDKINMMNRCYRFFSGSSCSPELIAAMAVVVERARLVIAAGAVVVAAALVVALIAAIIALAEVIAALAAAAAAAAAEAAAIGAAAAAVITLLVTIKEGLSSEEPSSTL